MKTIVIRIIFIIVRMLDYLVPKKDNAVVFYSSPDYTDNCRAMYETLLRERPNHKYKITWVVNNVDKYREIISGAHVVKHRSLKSLAAFLRCKYIIRTHSYWDNVYVPKRQIMCVAWHGMLIKGYHHSEIGTYPRNGHDYFCVTSPLFQKLFAQMFNADFDRFNITGFPRNDYLFADAPDLKALMHLDTFDKVIIWMPTFRSYANGVDGDVSDFGLPTLHDGDLVKLNEYLEENNFCLLLKLHPWALDSLGELNYSNIREIRDSDIPAQYSLYHLLGKTDALISDYSSVWGDYLLTDKPVAFAFDDLESMKKRRYIPLSPLEDYMPGMKTKNVDDLISFFESLKQEDIYKEERKRIRDLFLTHQDANSSRRFLEAIGLLGSK